MADKRSTENSRRGVFSDGSIRYGIDKLRKSAASGRTRVPDTDFAENDALQHTVIRDILLRKEMPIEVLANCGPGLYYVSKWWKQLYGESEGKDQRESSRYLQN